MTAGDRDYVNITEAAALIGVSRVTVWRWIRDGRLPALRLGHRTTRIRRADLDRLLDQPRHDLPAPNAASSMPAGAEQERSLAAFIPDSAAAERVRDEFLAFAGLEPNTPLAGLSAEAQFVIQRLARAGDTEPERVMTALQSIAGQAGDLARLIERILEDSPPGLDGDGSGSGHHDVLTDLAASHARAFGEGPSMSARTPVDITAASPRLKQVLIGLLDNAVKYGSESDPIDVVVSLAAPEVVELSVPDRGSGLTPGQRIQNLERFYRDHGESRQNGLGLGQFISRQIVDLHGGEIRAEFPADGAARFVVRLPLETAHRAAFARRKLLGDG